MFEKEGTPTILGMTAGEWEAVAGGLVAGFRAPILRDFPKCPPEHIEEKHYYETLAVVGNMVKILALIEVINYAGIAVFTSGMI